MFISPNLQDICKSTNKNLFIVEFDELTHLQLTHFGHLGFSVCRRMVVTFGVDDRTERTDNLLSKLSILTSWLENHHI